MKKKQRLIMVEFGLICAEFLRLLVIAFLGADIALSYEQNGVNLNLPLVLTIITVFGIYGFLSYGVTNAKNFLRKNKYYPIN